uniref:Uncharacterized protein n=1 Tax=Anguilla anguilla TaxID=7936 RepID=A0A0E9V1A3_ANGAN
MSSQPICSVTQSRNFKRGKVNPLNGKSTVVLVA